MSSQEESPEISAIVEQQISKLENARDLIDNIYSTLDVLLRDFDEVLDFAQSELGNNLMNFAETVDAYQNGNEAELRWAQQQFRWVLSLQEPILGRVRAARDEVRKISQEILQCSVDKIREALETTKGVVAVSTKEEIRIIMMHLQMLSDALNRVGKKADADQSTP